MAQAVSVFAFTLYTSLTQAVSFSCFAIDVYVFLLFGTVCSCFPSHGTVGWLVCQCVGVHAIDFTNTDCLVFLAWDRWIFPFLSVFRFLLCCVLVVRFVR